MMESTPDTGYPLGFYRDLERALLRECPPVNNELAPRHVR